MKIIQIIAGAVLSGMIATFICWGLLIFYAKFILHGKGSLFDANPNAAIVFFLIWGVMSLISMLIGASIMARALSARTQ
ncbi:MAG TPA: hypothetical protein VLK60_03480 [Variovorax sp.]|jgi:membrane associated rhomboid family serine protease|nr:hypothetical protein [Variovorax sp.]